MSAAKIRLRQAAGDLLFRVAGRPVAAPGTLTILNTRPRLAQMSEASMREELRESSARIADRIGARPDTFAYPFGAFDSFDSRTRQALAEAGFRTACTTVFGRNTPASDPLALKRLRVSWCDGEGEIARMLGGVYDWYARVQRWQSWQAVVGAANQC